MLHLKLRSWKSLPPKHQKCNHTWLSHGFSASLCCDAYASMSHLSLNAFIVEFEMQWSDMSGLVRIGTCKSLVSFESRKGIWAALPSDSLPMTLPRVSSDLLMKAPSRVCPLLSVTCTHPLHVSGAIQACRCQSRERKLSVHHGSTSGKAAYKSQWSTTSFCEDQDQKHVALPTHCETGNMLLKPQFMPLRQGQR